ncbi:DUF2142 domain-containing protein [Salinibacterium hongtaonis]|uniref:DUF2142 domain-containing protein n=1 Tax=Homoserinimonas hongtaonis TaxID=2079791 RepID=A0A2U1SWS7_9MICO|nr:DUF2142 domain-containing protein [Salinibacterium hongtaonis]PWB96056.1 hypothetical protein DF220_11730 [Salinibacterium hongtaonis]
METDSSLTGRRRLFALRIVTPLLAVFALAAWALASPPGASPDDDFHLASIWCSAPEAAGHCKTTSNSAQRTLPRDVGVDSMCYVRDTAMSAGCLGPDYGNMPQDTVTTNRGNFDGGYPGVFYSTMSLFVGDDISASVVQMRLSNSVIFVGLVTALFALLPLRHRPALLWSSVITMVPLGMYLVPSTNPSSWAIASGTTALLATLGYLETTGRRRLLLGAFALVAVVIGAGARADAAVYACLAIVAAAVLAFRKERSFFVAFALPVALIMIAAVFYLTSGQGTSAATGGMARGEVAEHKGTLVFLNFLNLPDLWAGMFGGYPLGWFDSPLPAIPQVMPLIAFAAVAFAGLRLYFRGKGLVAVGLVTALWAVPTFILLQTGAFVGEYVQPRYIYPLVIMLAAVLLLRTTEKQWVLTRGQLWLVIVALSTANSVALHSSIRRYVTGNDVVSWNLNYSVEWWWNLAISPAATWVGGSLAFLLGLVGVSLLTSRRTSPHAKEQPLLTRPAVAA